MKRNYKVENASVTSRVLRLLSDCQWHTIKDLKKVTGGGRYSARIYDLECEGYKISRRGDKQAKQYRLVSVTPGKPRHVRVKVFLEPADVRRLLKDQIQHTGTPIGRGCYAALVRRAEKALRAALARYEENEGK